MNFMKRLLNSQMTRHDQIQNTVDSKIQSHPVKLLTSPYLRCVQTSTYVGQALFRSAMREVYSREEMIEMLKNQSMMKPILFLANNLANCLSRKFQNFFDKGQLAKSYRNPEKFIKN